MTSPLVELRGLDRTYDSTPPVKALHNVDLVVSRGDYISVSGPSGSGKSTLLNVLGLLDRPTAGHYGLGGLETSALSDAQRTRLRGRGIGFVFQSFHLLPYRSAVENVAMGLLYRGSPHGERLELARKALDRVGLGARADFCPTALSGGERQRVAIARACVGDPMLLLCDEPTGNLDSGTTKSILALFDDLNGAGLTLIVITHDPEVSQAARRRVSISDGQLSSDTGDDLVPLTHPGRPTHADHGKRSNRPSDRRVVRRRSTSIENGSGVAPGATAPGDPPAPPDIVASALEGPDSKDARQASPRGSAEGEVEPTPSPWANLVRTGSTPSAVPVIPQPIRRSKRVARHLKRDSTRSISWLDLWREAVEGALARPARTALTTLGTILGVAALVATAGIAQTAGNQIITNVDELAATDVRVEPADSPTGEPLDSIPLGADLRIAELNGVRSVGLLTFVDTGDDKASMVPLNDPAGLTQHSLALVAATEGLFAAVRAELSQGRFFDAALTDKPVAVLGAGAAEQLGLSSVTAQPTVFMGDQAFSVIGIISDVERRPDLLDAIIVPFEAAEGRFGNISVGEVQIDTEPGAAGLIGRQAPIAINAANPEELRVRVPPEPKDVRAKVSDDVNALFYLLGGISLLIGALGIANVTLVSVLERTGEIGLRRALGATRRHIAVQFLTESTLVGAFGGLIGSSVAVLAIVLVSAVRDWTPVLDLSLPLLAPLAGALIGLLSGAYPAHRAASVEPVEALRSGT